MDPRTSDPRRARARFLYELGRARSAAWTALVVLPFAGVAIFACEGWTLVAILGAALYFLAAVLLFRGQVYGAAVGLGLLAGAAPLLAPLLFRRSGACCIGGACTSGCLVACIAGGIAAGLVIGWFAAKRQERPGVFWVAAAAVAALTGSLGCVTIGLASVVAMVAALVVTSIPTLGVMRARA
jgi:hypothetical protein